jgi:hypothetical protein
MDPEAVTTALGVTPTTQAHVGERVRPAVDGTPRPGVERESAWGVSVECRDKEADIDQWLAAFLDPFLPHRAFIRQLAAEATLANVDLAFPGQFHFGGELRATTLQAVASLGLTLGLEVFPDSAT